LILDWLAAKRIWHIRLNTGAMGGDYKGKKWFVRFGRPGMADILVWWGMKAHWLEVKNGVGATVTRSSAIRGRSNAAGMEYRIVRSLEEVEKLFG
jgi:hypothetical protein